MPPSSGGREAAWLARAAATPPQSVSLLDSHGGGHITDKALRDRLKVIVGGAAVPKGVTRDQLVEVASHLNVFSASACGVPKLVRRRGTTSWDRLTQEVVRRLEPYDDGDAWIPKDELSRRLVEHVGHAHPAKMGRDLLLQECLRFNIITQATADAAAPVYLDMGALRRLLGYPKGERKRAELLTEAFDRGLISQVQRDMTRTRPDLAAEAKAKHGTSQVVRCLGAKTMLAGLQGSSSILDRINATCELMTRLQFYGSRRLDLHLRSHLRAGLALPAMDDGNALALYVRHCFGAKTTNAGIRQVSTEFAPVFSGASSLRTPKNLGNTFKHACNVYAGALVVHFTDERKVLARVRKYASARLFGVFKKRDKRYDDVWRDDVVGVPDCPDDVGEAPVVNVEKAVANGCTEPDLLSLHERQREVALEIKQALELDAPLTKAWLRRHMHASIRFTHRLATVVDAQRQEAERVRAELLVANPSLPPDVIAGCLHVPQGVALVPLCSHDRKFITLDATDLATIVTRGSARRKDTDQDEGEVRAKECVRAAFKQNIGKVLGQAYACCPGVANGGGSHHATKYWFTGTVDTDGVSFHMHFERAKRPDERKKSDKKKPAAAVAKRTPSPPETTVQVDTGRVHLVKMVVMRQGRLLWRQRQHVSRRCSPLTLGLSNKQYRSEAGIVKKMKIDKARLRKEQLAHADMHRELAATTRKTADISMVARHLAAQTKLATQRRWPRLKAMAPSHARRACRVRKERALVRFWQSVKTRVEAVAGGPGSPVTLVWGVAVAATGKGNLPAPTTTIFKIAQRVLASWRIVFGCEFRTSKNTCDEHGRVREAHAVRLRSLAGKREVARRSEDRFQSRLRNGLVLGLNRRRALRRHAKGCWHKLLSRVTDVRITWEVDGHAGEPDDIKKEKKKRRLAEGVALVKYVRGLRVCQDENKLKFLDRDVNAAHNIGLLFLFDTVEGMQRPPEFVRPTKQNSAAPDAA